MVGRDGKGKAHVTHNARVDNQQQIKITKLQFETRYDGPIIASLVQNVE